MQSVVDNRQVSELLGTDRITPMPRRVPLRGIADEFAVYEIP
jgi:hypothetical protein